MEHVLVGSKQWRANNLIVAGETKHSAGRFYEGRRSQAAIKGNIDQHIVAVGAFVFIVASSGHCLLLLLLLLLLAVAVVVVVVMDIFWLVDGETMFLFEAIARILKAVGEGFVCCCY